MIISSATENTSARVHAVHAAAHHTLSIVAKVPSSRQRGNVAEQTRSRSSANKLAAKTHRSRYTVTKITNLVRVARRTEIGRSPTSYCYRRHSHHTAVSGVNPACAVSVDVITQRTSRTRLTRQSRVAEAASCSEASRAGQPVVGQGNAAGTIGRGSDMQPAARYLSYQNGLSISLICLVPQMLTSSITELSGTSMQCTSVRAKSSAEG